MEARDARTVEEILSSIGLTTLLRKFLSEKIDTCQIETMSDQEMARLGITTIGDRIRLRESAKQQQAVDLGGPRKEFFRLVLMEIKEKFFDNGIRELMAPEYRVVGIILAMSILQNGPMPTFLTPEVVEMLFSTVDSSQAIMRLREGFNVLGMYDLFMGLPELKFLLQPPTATLTLKRMITMLKPIFSGEGTNALIFEKEVYGYFVKYLREIAAGRRGSLTLSSVLNFVTCTSEKPVLGFKIQPSIYFCEVGDGYLPTASTCTNYHGRIKASNCQRLKSCLKYMTVPFQILFMDFSRQACGCIDFNPLSNNPVF